MSSEIKSQVDHAKERITAPMLSVSMSPHARTTDSIRSIMWTVNIALVPALMWSIYVFGFHALLQVIVATAACTLTEWAIIKFRKLDQSPFDGSAFLTGLLLAFCLPSTLPLWMTALGSIFAIGVAKHAFGGLGLNVFNPAQAARAFLVSSFPVFMTQFTSPLAATTTATPLGIVKEAGMDKLIEVFGSQTELYKSLFFGLRAGSLGEVSVFLLLLGGLFLVWKKYIYWQTPVTYIATIALFSYIFGGKELFTGDPLLAILSGGVILGAFFMVTDMVTTPISILGQMIFCFFAGIIVVLIRKFGAYPEGVCYSILLMNAFTPLIDLLIKPRAFKKESAT